jgi:hypothetical protein
MSASNNVGDVKIALLLNKITNGCLTGCLGLIVMVLILLAIYYGRLYYHGYLS